MHGDWATVLRNITRCRLACVCRVLAVLGLALVQPLLSYGQVGVLTYHNDNARTGQNTDEIILAPNNVNSNQFGKLFSYPVDGYIVGQPLYLQNVSIPGSGSHNVVYVSTMHDSVYAFDADTNNSSNSSPLWTVSFINPSAGITTVPVTDAGCGGVTEFTEQGVIGTPVIDPNSGTLYVIAKTKENGNYVQRLHALDTGTGQEKFGGPVLIAASANGTGDGGTTVSFDPLRNMSRTGLLLANGVLYTSFGSNGCKEVINRGWVIAYDASTLQQLAAFTTEPNSTNGGVWQSGSGPAADSNGNVFFETADGVFDANTGAPDFGDSILKLTLNGTALSLSDYFTPFNQAYYLQNDLDLSSVGPLLLPDQPGQHPHLLVGSGKDATIYLVDRDNMGQFNPSRNQIVQTLPPPSASSRRWGGPVYWNQALYFVTGGVLEYTLSGGLLSPQPVSQTSQSFGAIAPPSISANGTSNGILWFVSRTLTASGTLHALDPTNLSTEFYNSDQAGTRDTLGTVTHFPVPTIANGKVYVGTQTELVVYGLTGVAPGVGLSASTLTFGSQVVGTTSSSQAVTLTNNGTAPLSVNSVTVSGDFAQTNTCTTNVPAGASCTITVSFTPTASGTRSGSVTVTDDASGSPQAVSLTGTGTSPAPAVGLSVSSLTFGSQPIGTISATQSVTLTNTGNATLNITGFTIAPNFSQTNSCGASVTVGVSCTITVAFAPTSGGSLGGTLSIADNASGSPQAVTLSGTGADFSFSAPPATVPSTVAGQQATYTLSLSPIGGFNQSLNLSCSGVPMQATCSVSPASLTFNGNSPVTITVIVKTGADTPGGTYTLTVTGTGTVTHTLSLPLQVANFTVSTSPPTLTLTAGGSATATLSLTPQGFQGNVSLSCGGAPALVTCSVSPASLVLNGTSTATATVTVAAPASVPGGAYALALIVGGGVTHSAPFTLNVRNFSLSAASGSQTSQEVTPGQSATYNLNLTPTGGFNQAVSLSCIGAPSEGSCSVLPSTVTPNGLTPTKVTVTVSTTAPSSAGSRGHRAPPPRPGLGNPWPLVLVGLVLTVVLCGPYHQTAGARRHSGSAANLAAFISLCEQGTRAPKAGLAFGALLMLLWASCGGGGMAGSGNAGTPAGTYSLTVTGTSTSGSASLTQSVKLALTVQ